MFLKKAKKRSKNVGDSRIMEEIQMKLWIRWKITQRKCLVNDVIAQWYWWEIGRQSKSASQGYEIMGRDTQVRKLERLIA